MLVRKLELMLPHIELLRTFSHSGMKIILWQDPTVLFQDKWNLINHSETPQIILDLVKMENFIPINSQMEIRMIWKTILLTIKVTQIEDTDL